MLSAAGGERCFLPGTLFELASGEKVLAEDLTTEPWNSTKNELPKRWATKIQTMAPRNCIGQYGTKTFQHGPSAANTFTGVGANGEGYLHFFLKQSTK